MVFSPDGTRLAAAGGGGKIRIWDVATGRVLAEDIVADVNLPDFPRSIMDGFAIRAASTFGASDGNPAYINVPWTVAMGEIPSFSIGTLLPTGQERPLMAF